METTFGIGSASITTVKKGGFKNASMPDMKREQEVCMSDSSNNNACTCSYTGSFGNEYFGANASSETGSPSNSYKNAIAFSSKSNTLPKGRHARTMSNVSTKSARSRTLSHGSGSDECDEEITLFVHPVSKKLLCMLCGSVFKEPIIASCGHTFCRICVSIKNNEPCPVDGAKLTAVVANLAVDEQINELYIHCKYGCRPCSSGVPGEYEIHPDGCPMEIKFGTRAEHEALCEYAPIRCPNSSTCPTMIKLDLEEHLAQCQHLRCPNSRFNCPFKGTDEQVDSHLKDCKFEGLKDFLQHTEERMQRTLTLLEEKDQEISFLKSMLAKVTERMDRMEKAVEIRVDLLDEGQTKLSSDLLDARRSLNHIEQELSSMDARVFNIGSFDVQPTLKCKGTFVGHQGPVWCLSVFGYYLFSGSSDNTIKVWDTRSNYKCIKTLNDHTGMILALCAHRGRLYSGSADCTIGAYDLESLELIENVTGGENPICTLAVGQNMLFSGSLKSIKVWDLQTLKTIKELTGLNHWVRALFTNDLYLFSGSYQTILVWDLQTLECIRSLETSGGSVYSIAVTRQHIACGTYENCIHVWDVNTYKKIGTLSGHVGTVYDLVVMQMVDTTKIISASYDRSLRVWSLDNMNCVQTLIRHQGSVTSLAVSRGRLFSGAVDSTVKVWQ
ncbi:E3 ubiquitin-protein ligase TRAF7-like isoform X3 [Rhopilema esculentum]|uniref:E3 ubiquitin-protein ligase TRAF7-like isoform X3 n=2 Tax=Rhopilema esculentum TaxID=499914 RepID=UPI0031D30542